MPRRDRGDPRHRRRRAAPRWRAGGHRLRGGGMRDALARKHHRQQALLRVVSGQRLSTQADVVRALRRAGFAATQATVSRDIVELGLVKVARDGTHAYAPPSAAAPGGGIERLRRFCEDYPVEGALATNLVVLRSLPGTANALAAALDASSLEEVVGTLAGDDTVFIAATTERHARSLLGRLTSFGIARRDAK
ncbi:MAG: arginine repressor [Chloroflexi bacterium]|nr:MAG: arginine repressor [Chloroflexota bacterium]